MAYDRDRQSDSCGVVAAVLLVLILVVVVMAVGSILWIRTQRLTEVARAEAERARMMAVQAQAQAKAAHDRQTVAEADPDTSDSIDAQQITLRLDEDGNVSLTGSAIPLGDLEDELRRMFDVSSVQLTVVIQVSGRCPFEHVARTRTLCKEAGAGRVRLELFER
jgi:biopolymer transport protein ExbD